MFVKRSEDVDEEASRSYRSRALRGGTHKRTDFSHKLGGTRISW